MTDETLTVFWNETKPLLLVTTVHLWRVLRLTRPDIYGAAHEQPALSQVIAAARRHTLPGVHVLKEGNCFKLEGGTCRTVQEMCSEVQKVPRRRSTSSFWLLQQRLHLHSQVGGPRLLPTPT
jgi:hypothetical protein